jgi:hypothetical protein
LQNRVTPEGAIIAHPARGLFMGNRGCLHDEYRRIVRPYGGKLWITCLTAFSGRRRTVMTPGLYTELFFLDEAVALAAGHRPCGECRRADYERYIGSWRKATGGPRPKAGEMDEALDAARIDRRTKSQLTIEAELASLPDGTFIRYPGESRPLLVCGEALFPYDLAGYGDPYRRPASATVTILTPAPNVAVLLAGYRPRLHPSAMG